MLVAINALGIAERSSLAGSIAPGTGSGIIQT